MKIKLASNINNVGVFIRYIQIGSNGNQWEVYVALMFGDVTCYLNAIPNLHDWRASGVRCQ